MSRTSAGQQTSKPQLLVVAAMLFLASAYFYQDPGWNGNSRLDLTRAIVEQHSVVIDSYKSRGVWATADLAFHNGHYYSDKAIGSSVFAVPLYFLLLKLGLTASSAFVKHVLTTIVMGSAFTAAGLAMFLIARRLSQGSWKALIATLAVSLGTMLWPYSAVYYGHVPAAAFLIVAFYLLLVMHQQPTTASSARLALAGFALGLAFITEYTAGLIIAGLLVYAAYALRKQGFSTLVRRALAGACGAAFPLLLMFAYNIHVYGTLLATGYSFEALPYFHAGMSGGVMGINWPAASTLFHITFDPRVGLFWLSPVLLLAPIGFYAAFKWSQYRAEALLALYCVTAMLVMNSGYYLWWGGGAFGPRLIIPGLPFFIVPLALLPNRWTWVLGALAILSAFQMLIPLMGKIQPNLIYEAEEDTFYLTDIPFRGFSLLYDYNLPLIVARYQNNESSWMLGTALGTPYWLSAPALVAAEAVMAWVFGRASKSLPASSDSTPAQIA